MRCMPKLIPLTNGKFATVDDEDFNWLSQWDWYALKTSSDSIFYAVRTENGASIRMHRLINGTPDDMFTDHRDGDGLNNQRYNLRTATPLQNMMNRRGKRGGTSRFKGVFFDPTPQKKQWRAAIRLDGKLKYLGRFYTDDEAGSAYANAAREYFGEFACTISGALQ